MFFCVYSTEGFIFVLFLLKLYLLHCNVQYCNVQHLVFDLLVVLKTCPLELNKNSEHERLFEKLKKTVRLRSAALPSFSCKK